MFTINGLVSVKGYTLSVPNFMFIYSSFWLQSLFYSTESVCTFNVTLNLAFGNLNRCINENSQRTFGKTKPLSIFFCVELFINSGCTCSGELSYQQHNISICNDFRHIMMYRRNLFPFVCNFDIFDIQAWRGFEKFVN